MREIKLKIIAAAMILAVAAAGCYDGEADWEDTLPVAATDISVTETEPLTEETEETTTLVTFETTESTKRTAATESTPELATTLTTEASETERQTSDSTTIVPDVPKVPISEFTSSTPLNLAEAAASASSSSETSETTTLEVPGIIETENGTSVFLELPLGETSSSVTTAQESLTGETSGTLSADPADLLKRPYSYQFLTGKQRTIYDSIINAAERHSKNVAFSSDLGVTAEDYQEVYQIIYDDEQALFYIDTKMQYAVNSATKKIANATMFYKYNEAETAEMQRKIDSEANKILAGAGSDMTDYDKVKYFHDTLASTVVYDETAPNCRDIYGVFVDKKAICGGYSKAFSYLCGKAGIETVTVTGDADGQPHMWNKVKIDGKWYNIDITYAVSAASDVKYVRYDYFCVPDSMLAESRTVYEQTYTYPEAVSDDCGYFLKNGLIAGSWEEARKILLDGIVKASKTKEPLVQVKCADKEVYQSTVYNLFDSSRKQALDIFDEALPNAENKFDCSVINYNQDSTSMVVKLFIEYTE